MKAVCQLPDFGSLLVLKIRNLEDCAMSSQGACSVASKACIEVSGEQRGASGGQFGKECVEILEHLVSFARLFGGSWWKIDGAHPNIHPLGFDANGEQPPLYRRIGRVRYVLDVCWFDVTVVDSDQHSSRFVRM